MESDEIRSDIDKDYGSDGSENLKDPLYQEKEDILKDLNSNHHFGLKFVNGELKLFSKELECRQKYKFAKVGLHERR